MKTFLQTFIVFFTFITLTGCSKFLNEENRMEGEWRLSHIDRTNFLSWRSVQNNYASGTFHFFRDGSAIYTDNLGEMNGNWMMRKEKNRYRDSNGEWKTDDDITLEINLYNFTQNRVLQLYFDKIRYKNRNTLIAEYSTPNYRYRYEFDRR